MMMYNEMLDRIGSILEKEDLPYEERVESAAKVYCEYHDLDVSENAAEENWTWFDVQSWEMDPDADEEINDIPADVLTAANRMCGLDTAKAQFEECIASLAESLIEKNGLADAALSLKTEDEVYSFKARIEDIAYSSAPALPLPLGSPTYWPATSIHAVEDFPYSPQIAVLCEIKSSLGLDGAAIGPRQEHEKQAEPGREANPPLAQQRAAAMEDRAGDTRNDPARETNLVGSER